MTDPEIYALENKYGVQGIDSADKHLKYFCGAERLSLGVAGEWGMTILTVEQAVAMHEELGGVLEVYFNVKV